MSLISGDSVRLCIFLRDPFISSQRRHFPLAVPAARPFALITNGHGFPEKPLLAHPADSAMAGLTSWWGYEEGNCGPQWRMERRVGSPIRLPTRPPAQPVFAKLIKRRREGRRIADAPVDRCLCRTLAPASDMSQIRTRGEKTGGAKSCSSADARICWSGSGARRTGAGFVLISPDEPNFPRAGLRGIPAVSEP